jgi:hypothetical protein
VQLIADPDFERPVEHVPELVLASVNVRRGSAARGSQVLEQHEASSGAFGGRLDRHRVANDPDAFALAPGDGMRRSGHRFGRDHGLILLRLGGDPARLSRVHKISATSSSN